MGLKEKSRTSKLGGKPTSIHSFGGLFKPRTRPDLALALSLVLFAFVALACAPYAKAADPGHAASSISSGQFESGDYTFPSNLTVTRFFIANGTTLYVDAINGRVGIGTASPTHTLNVFGTANITGAITAGSTIAAASSIYTTGSSATIYSAADIYTTGSGDDLWLGTTTQANSLMQLYASGRLSVLSNNLTVNETTGYVGIGTASPNQKLQVVGTANATDYVCSSAGCINAVELNSDVAGTGLGSSSGVLSVNAGDGLGTSGDNVIVNTLAGGGIVTSSDSLSLNRSCGSSQILKWSGSNWYCADDSGIGSEADPLWSGNASSTCSLGSCTVGSGDTLSGPTVGDNLDMGSTYYITNIGHANTDFTTGGGLTLNGNFSVLGTGTHTIAGNSNFDGNTLFVNASTHYVGIGTGSPNRKLEVRGTYTSPIGQIYLNADAGQNGFFTVNADADREAGIGISSAGSSKWYMYRPVSSNDLRFYDTQDRVTIQNGGNVGIGTGSPTTKLDVNGSLNITDAAGRIRTPELCLTTDSCRTTWPTGGSGGGWATSGNYVYNNSAVVQVGIGTGSPSASKLVVNGSMTTSDYPILAVNGLGGIGMWRDDTPSNAWVIGHATPGGSLTNDLIFSHYSPWSEKMRVTSTGLLEVAGGIRSTSFTAPTSGTGLEMGYYSASGYGYVYTYNRSASEYVDTMLGIDGNQLYLDSGGDVGIGMTGPGAKLDVYEPATGVPLNSVLKVEGYANAVEEGPFIDFHERWGGNYPNWIVGRIGAVYETNSPGSNMGALVFHTANSSDGNQGTAATSEKMRIQGDGNVGIRTTTPSFPLSFGTSLGNKIGLFDSGSGVGYGFGIQAGLLQIFADSSSDRVGIGYGNSASFTETLTVKGGNVGIGTTGPQAGMRMDVRSDTGDGNSAITAYGYNGNGGMAIHGYGYATTGTGNNYGLYGNSLGGRASGTNIGGYFEASGAANNYALITGAGNVGIGTASPNTHLEIAVDAIPDEPLRLSYGPDTNNYHRIMTSYHGSMPTSNYMDFQVQSAASTPNSVLFLRGDGNVGIGTGSPGDYLAITGGITIGNKTFGSGYNGIYLNGLTGTGNYNILSNPSDYNLYFNRPTGAYIYFRENNANQVTIEASTGDVGIGMTDPKAYLDVIGSASATRSLLLRSGDSDSVPADSNQILFGYNGGNDYMHDIRTRHNGGTDAGNAIDFYVWDYGTDAVSDTPGTNFVMTLNGGNVGIGTTGPNNKLEVNGSGDGSNLARVRVTSSDNQAGISFLSDNTGEVVVYSPDGTDNLVLYAGSNNRITCESDGDVAILLG